MHRSKDDTGRVGTRRVHAENCKEDEHKETLQKQTSDGHQFVPIIFMNAKEALACSKSVRDVEVQRSERN